MSNYQLPLQLQNTSTETAVFIATKQKKQTFKQLFKFVYCVLFPLLYRGVAKI